MKKIIKLLIITIIISINMGVTSFCDDDIVQTIYKNKLIFEDFNNNYYAAELNLNIYNNSKSDLSDLRVENDKNVATPYFIYNYDLVEKDTEKIIPNNIIDSYSYLDKENEINYLYVLTQVLQKENETFYINSLKVNTLNKDFASNVVVEGSYDKETWDFITEDIIYDINDTHNNTINFNKDVNYNYYRLKIVNNVKDIQIESVELILEDKISNVKRFIKELKIDTNNTKSAYYETIQEKNQSIIRIFGLKNVNINTITINSGDTFNRKLYTNNNQYSIYNYNFENYKIKNTVIEYNDQVKDNDYLELNIMNNDDTPINIDDITVSYFVDLVIFEKNDKQDLYLTYGNESLSKPNYDIEQYFEHIINEGYELVEYENTEIINVKSDLHRFSMSDKLFDMIIITIAVILSGVVIIAIVKKK